MKDRIKPLSIQQYIKLARNKEMISFAAGLPDVSVLPLDKVKEEYAFIIEENDQAFQYQAPSESLKRHIQSMMAAKSLSCQLDEILITSGAQQGIYLTANLLLEKYSQVMVEEFVYPGFLQVADMFCPEYTPITTSYNQGMDLNYLESILKTNKPIPYLYVVCNGHNPLGMTWDSNKRKDLAFLADKYGFIVIEDDPYGYLSFTEEHYAPIRAYTNNAIYISSFSKIIAPAIRVGWIVGDKELIQPLEHLKDMNDLYLSNPNQLMLNRLLNKYSLTDIAAPQIALYKEKLTRMKHALDEHMKIPFRWVIPEHGMFIWLEFPSVNIETHLDSIFEEAGVLFIPGSAFSVERNLQKQAIRLNFTSPSFADIDLGIKKLSEVLLKISKMTAL